MSYASDVLFMIGAGLAQGKIKAPDIEIMLSDGPKRVPMLELVMQALAEFPQPLSGTDAEKIPEPPRARPTPPSAHPALAAANEWAELTADWDRLPFGTRAYYDALAKCDAAWERIAVACGEPAVQVDAPLPPMGQRLYRTEAEVNDELLQLLLPDLQPDDLRTDGGSVNMPKVRSLLADRRQRAAEQPETQQPNSFHQTSASGVCDVQTALPKGTT